MILQRLATSIRKQDWVTVLIETLIVVLGVFLGIQLGNWNEARVAQANAQEYRERLVTDLHLSVASNQRQMAFSRLQIDQLDLVLTALTSCKLEHSDAPIFEAGLYNMGKLNLPTMVMSTIDELNATGDFKLIGDPVLRRSISETAREYRTILGVEPQITGRIIPNVNYVRSRVGFRLDEHLDFPTSIDAGKIVYDFDALCTDEQFANAVAAVREVTLANVDFNRRVRDRQSELLTELKAAP